MTYTPEQVLSACERIIGQPQPWLGKTDARRDAARVRMLYFHALKELTDLDRKAIYPMCGYAADDRNAGMKAQRWTLLSPWAVEAFVNWVRYDLEHPDDKLNMRAKLDAILASRDLRRRPEHLPAMKSE